MVSIELLSILLPLEACLVEADTVRWAKVNSDGISEGVETAARSVASRHR